MKIPVESLRWMQVAETGATIQIKNEGHHWIIELGQTRVDYWPSSEAYQVTFKTKVRHGFSAMMADLTGKGKDEKPKRGTN